MTDTVADGAEDRGLELDELGDKLESFYTLRHAGSAEADAVLNKLGADSDTDREILLELGAPKPLYRADRFPQAHAMVVRSLEVLDRNGTRDIETPNWLGPLKPVAGFLVGLVVRFIVNSHLRNVIDKLRRLYTRREANCLLGDPALAMLTRSRTHTERLTEGFKKNPLGVPSFLLGGAVISALLGAIGDAVGAFTGSSLIAIVITVVLVLLFLVAVATLIYGSAIARRRIRLTTERPLRSLYEVVGMCGNPPKDKAKDFALISIILMGLMLIVVPLLIAVILFT